MNSSGEICRVSGRYSMYDPTGHAEEQVIIEGEVFPKCRACDQLVHWTLLHETDRWGDYVFQSDAPGSTFSAMTINERLFDANLMDEFNAAISRRDRNQMISLLLKVGLSLPVAEGSTADILARRARQS